MATLKFQTITFREKNPNRIPVQFFRGDTPIVPTEELALFLELRADPAGRLLAELSLTQLTLESTTLITPIFDLPASTYYVDLRQSPVDGPVYRSGVCALQVLPIGSLAKISDGVGLSITLDESTQVLNVVLDATPFSLLAETIAEQAEQVAANTETVVDSKQQVDQAKAETFEARDETQVLRDEAEQLLSSKENIGVAAALVAALKAGSSETIASLKAAIDALAGLLDSSVDGDSVVNRIAEVLAIFNSYPEGAMLVSALAAKVDKVDGKGLSANDLTNVLLNAINSHLSSTTNPHNTTAAQVGALKYAKVATVAAAQALATGSVAIIFRIADDGTGSKSYMVYEPDGGTGVLDEFLTL